MRDSFSFAVSWTSRCAVAVLMTCTLAFPAFALADQGGAGETAVYVAMELDGEDEPSRELAGDAEAGAEAAKASMRPGSLPETGDSMGACSLAAAVVAGVAAGSLAARRKLGARGAC